MNHPLLYKFHNKPEIDFVINTGIGESEKGLTNGEKPTREF